MSTRRRRSDGEGSITPYQSATGPRWRISWREHKDPDRPELGRRQRTRRGFETERAARQELRDMLSKAERGQRTTVSADTFEPYALKWLKSKRVSESTWDSYHRLLTLHAIPRIGGLHIAKPRSTARLPDRWIEV
ncbi:Arm DNA-binding domain-containing protein [Pseudactinotalea sp. Z1748]|uniref:Arm DNA-binding domain-containing protein n=1 Tax=Pseudactinotalea sp. Z1748 TaxID=3413027 RepID=UPI003C7A466C